MFTNQPGSMGAFLTGRQGTLGLSKQQLESLPVTWSIPGQYQATYKISCRLSIKFASIRTAKELYLKVQGSVEAIDAKYPLILPDFPPHTIQPHKFRLYEWHRKASLNHSPLDPFNISFTTGIPGYLRWYGRRSPPIAN
ncbi:hypothetical protein CC78DRAFT_603439 [Lojkania enalia]|uniref:Uncharacterized protein n=1 Tax=Lojkania enalia TaxID=147567 RepID=A0A9P4KBZ6_9PLEO|nr:hypothetical protein CC78DRAFT_603439 [Didymosphaeria enalia]